MVATPADLNRRLRAGLVWELVLRDLRLRYRRSTFGVLWSLVPPVTYVVVLTVVFGRVVPLDIADYPVFVLLGMLPWLWFQQAVQGATTSVVGAGDLVRHPSFPREALPLAAVVASATHFLLALPVGVGAALVATGRLPATAVVLPALVAVQGLLCLGPAFLLAAVHVRLRDTAHAVGVALVPLFYATPVFYDARSLDEAPVLRLNPLAPVVDGYRDALLRGVWPDPVPLALVAALGLVGTSIGLRHYRSRMPRFLEEL